MSCHFPPLGALQNVETSYHMFTILPRHADIICTWLYYNQSHCVTFPTEGEKKGSSCFGFAMNFLCKFIFMLSQQFNTIGTIFMSHFAYRNFLNMFTLSKSPIVDCRYAIFSTPRRFSYYTWLVDSLITDLPTFQYMISPGPHHLSIADMKDLPTSYR